MGNVISLHIFLETFLKSSTILQKPVILFTIRDHYPLLFFARLSKFFSRNGNNYVTTIDLRIVSRGEAQRQLQGSFLGLKTVFWLSSLADLPATEQQSWIGYLALYKGPHCIVACTTSVETLQKYAIDYVEIPNIIAFDTIIHVASLSSQSFDRERLNSFFKVVIAVTGALSVEQVCLLLSYFCVAGKNNEQFCKELLPFLVPPQHSLFALSDALFEKNRKKFTLLWSILSPQFSMQFWIAFWSEQFWRAYFYMVCMKSGRIADAKKIAYRLPFSFIQKSWKHHTFESLVKAHNCLYELDHACKNGAGGQEAMLDLVCFEFLH